MSSTSKATDIWSAPGFEGLTPLDVERDSKSVIHAGLGKTIVEFRDDLVVKYGTKVDREEGRTMIYIKKHTSIPIPSVYAIFTYEPDKSDATVDPKPPMQTYIIMDRVLGAPLHVVWRDFNARTRSAVCRNLAGYVEQLRSLGGSPFIGGLLLEPVGDDILENAADQGPFHGVGDFHDALALIHADRQQQGDIEAHVSQVLNNRGYAVKYTHANLRQSSIMVQDDGNIVGIVDWSMAGHYPEYWEFVKMHQIDAGQGDDDDDDDWHLYILENFRPYFAELEAYKTIRKW